MDLLEAVGRGRLDGLKGVRDVLATSLLEAEPDKRAALAARLTDVLEQIDRLSPMAKVGDPVDEIAERRTARGAGTAKSRREAGANQG
jgi:hypothetical protein